MMQKPWLELSDIKTARWTKAKNGRLIPLNSAAWRKLRRSVLEREPLCRHCAARGLIVPSVDVDHIDNNPANDEPSNHQALCHECHSRKTARDMGGNVRMGCATDGTPLDSTHHWNNAATGAMAMPTGAMVERSLGTDESKPYVPPFPNANCESLL